jgi:hypothetical protein
VGFELTIPMFERVKTVHVLDRAATMIGFWNILAFPIQSFATRVGLIIP